MDFLKKHWKLSLAGAAVILVALLVRYRNDVTAKMTGLPASLKTWLRIAGVTLPIGYVLLSGGDALAATCCAASMPGAIGAWLAEHGLTALAGIASLALGSIGLGLIFGADDTLDLEDSQGGRIITYTPGAAAQEKSLFVNVHRKLDDRGRPLIATAITIKVETTVTNPVPGAGVNSILEDDLARLLESVSIESPLLGTLLDKSTGRGPVLDLLITYLGLGFNNSGEKGVDAIAAGATGKVTKYFTFPLATYFLADPLITGQYLGSLDKTEIKVRIAANTCLGAPVSAGATVSGADSTISGVVSYVAHSHFFRPKMSYYRLETPSSGSDGLTFKNFGDKGPKASTQLDRVTTIGQVSNLKGLPGNTTIDNITRILAPSIGLDDVQNIDVFVMKRIAAQRTGMTGKTDYADGGNWAMGATAALGGMALDKLLVLNLLQAGQGMRVQSGKLQVPGSEIKIREEFTAPRTNADAFMIHSVRDMDPTYVAAVSKLYGGAVPQTDPVPAGRQVARR